MFDASTLPEPLLTALVALGAVHVLALLVARAVSRWAATSEPRAVTGQADEASRPERTDSTPETDIVATDGPLADADAVVRCPDCGTANERGYRFCRDCVGVLPGADGRAVGGRSVWRGNPL